MIELNLDLVGRFLRLRSKYNFREAKAFDDGDMVSFAHYRKLNNDLTDLVSSLECVYGFESFEEALKCFAKRKEQIKRVKRRLRGMLEAYGRENCRFITFTFDDEHLSRLKPTTAKRYVRLFLNECSKEYVFNLDRGSQNDRLHVHAFVGFVGKISYKVLQNAWNYGNLDFQKIRTSKNSEKKLATYMNKLAYHAGKLGTSDLTFSRIPRDERGYIDLDSDSELPF